MQPAFLYFRRETHLSKHLRSLWQDGFHFSRPLSVYTDKVPVNQYIPALLPPRYEWCIEDSQFSSCCLACSSLSPNVLCLRLRQRERHVPQIHFPALFVQTDRTFLAVSDGKQPVT